MQFKRMYFSDFLTERKGLFEPDDEKIQELTKIEKIDFSEGNLHLGKYKPTKTKQLIVEPNDFVFSGLNIEKGAVSLNLTGLRLVVSANYSTCKINFDVIDKEFLSYLIRSQYFKSILIDHLKKDYGFTRPKHLMPLSFFAPSSIEDQRQIVEQLKRTEVEGLELKSELTRQQALLKKLRQQILQEAIEGKLTADWRAQNTNVEPASELLKRIAAEKAQLVKDKKIKAQKPMASITDDEKTFELPEGWEWCRLGDVAEIKVGATPDRNNPEYWGGTIHWVSSGEVANNYISNTREKITHKALGESSARINPKGSVLVAMIGQGKTRGQTAILNIDAATNQNVCAIRPHDGIIPEIVWYFFLSRYEKTRSGASGGNQPALNGIKIRNTVFGLPSIAEANEIIKKLRDMECIINQIESQIIQNRTHADQLMQAILKEAFSHNRESESTAAKSKTSADTPEVAGA